MDEPDRVRIAERLVALRGDRKQRAIAREVGVSPQAISLWETTGRVGREYAEDYDAALGAGGEVLALLGFTPRSGGPSLADVMGKLDELLAAVHGMGAVMQRLVADETGRPLPAPPSTTRSSGGRRSSADPSDPVRRP